MRKGGIFFILDVIVLFVAACSAQEEYGLCIISQEGVVSINENSLYPMHSVVKFPQALYIADYMQTNGICLDSMVVIRKDELMQDTWSPMLETMEEEREFSIRELLRLSLAESDNNACDLLFSLFGSPRTVDSFIKGLGVEGINVSVTERQMHDDITLASQNSCTPSGMARLLLWFNEHRDDNACLREVWEIMASCNTGAERIPAVFGSDCRVIHKTGTGFTTENGMPQMNDAGIVIHSDGKVQIVAVFVPHPASTTELAEIVKSSLN